MATLLSTVAAMAVMTLTCHAAPNGALTTAAPVVGRTIGGDGSVSCNQADGNLYTAANGVMYMVMCGKDYTGLDMSNLSVSSYDACAESCSTDPRCKAFDFLAPGAATPRVGSNCFLKSAINANPGKTATAWGGTIFTLMTVTQTVTQRPEVAPSPTISTKTGSLWTPTRRAAVQQRPASTPTPVPTTPGESTKCFNCGTYTEKKTLEHAVEFFCKGGADGRFGGMLNRLMHPNHLAKNETIGMAYGTVTAGPMIVRVIVKTDPGCELDLGPASGVDCRGLMGRAITGCNADQDVWKQGGAFTNQCATWIVDPAPYLVPKGCNPIHDSVDQPKECIQWYRSENFYNDPDNVNCH